MVEHGAKVCIIKAPGINCDEETQWAFQLAGGNAEIVHVNELRDGRRKSRNCRIIKSWQFPAGFLTATMSHQVKFWHLK